MVGFPADSRQENDRDVPASLPLLDVGRGLEAVETRHLDVEQDDGEIVGEETLQRLITGRGEHQVLAQGLKRLLADDFAVILILRAGRTPGESRVSRRPRVTAPVGLGRVPVAVPRSTELPLDHETLLNSF